MNNTQLDMVLGYLNEGIEIDSESYQLEQNLSYFEEGANLDMRAKYKEYKPKIKKWTQAAKVYIKNGDKAKALEAYGHMEKLINEFEKDVKKIDSTVSSAVLGYFTFWTVSFWRDFLLGFVTAGIIGPVLGYQELANNIKAIYDTVKEEGVTANTVNLYRTRILAQINLMKLNMKSVKKSIEKMDKDM